MAGLISRCAFCNDIKHEKYACLTCLRNRSYEAKGIEIHTECRVCLVRTKLALNGQCMRCLKVAGLKECSGCKEIKSRELEFSRRYKRCDKCSFPCCKTSDCKKCLAAKDLKKCLTCEKTKPFGEFNLQRAVCTVCLKEGGRKCGVCALPLRATKGPLCVPHRKALKAFSFDPSAVQKALDWLLKRKA